MSDRQLQWQILPTVQPPAWFLQEVKRHAPEIAGYYAAQLLWQREIRDAEKLAGFLNPQLYKPASPFEFGEEMHLAMKRLKQAIATGEKVAIWGDFDADGITSTSVLWEGLGQFFQQNEQLFYSIPNRLTESHGLNIQGIDSMVAEGIKLIVTCDTGSTNISEIEYANRHGIDVIVTDHHTLPESRPPVTAIINPRYLSTEHQLYNLSGVAVAYKLVEALYQSLPDVAKQPIETLLDLVAIGLIADLVQLSGDCRYLAQCGIAQLRKQSKQQNPQSEISRPGLTRLLELCERSGDRPTDISFGIGPRINAVSRIQGDATFCVELLTSRNPQRCEELAYQTELANSRRKSLQKDLATDVKKKLSQMDLSTTSVIVLCEPNWPVGVLGLVAGQVAQEYGMPTILLSTQSDSINPENSDIPTFARGSARSVNQIDLYQLVKSQSHLLHRFGGHPLAAGLSISVDNIPVFTESINQQLRSQLGGDGFLQPIIQADILCTVGELGKDLFNELRRLEPCGMGNPVPKLLIQNCWFENVRNRNIKDVGGKDVKYIKTEFEIWDDSSPNGFIGIWWGHYVDDLPSKKQRCDVIAELDYNSFKKCYEIRLLAVRPSTVDAKVSTTQQIDWLLDWRGTKKDPQQLPTPTSSPLVVEECPSSWDELQVWFRRAIASNQKLAIAYSPPNHRSPIQIWQDLVGIAKHLSRTGKPATLQQLKEKLGIKENTLHLGIQALLHLGFQIYPDNTDYQFIYNPSGYNGYDTANSEIIEQFLAAIQEEQFLNNYFYQVPLATMQNIALHSKF